MGSTARVTVSARTPPKSSSTTAIIDRALFEEVQALLVARQPRAKGPRLTSAPSLLGGLVRCDCEISYALTTATGTSRTGKLYAYYKCIQATKQGRHKEGNGARCANRKIPRPVIEKLVIEALTDQLLQPDRVTSILLALKARRDERQASADRRIVDLARQAAEAEERLGRLYAAIEAGTVDGTDPTLKERVAALKATRTGPSRRWTMRRSPAQPRSKSIPWRLIGSRVREQLISGDVAARKAYLSSVVDAIIVSENKIRIVGSNDNIRSTFGPDGQPAPRVRKSVREWCPGAESNPRLSD